MPSVVGIGGPKGQKIDLEQLTRHLVEAHKPKPGLEGLFQAIKDRFSPPHWEESVARVRKNFLHMDAVSQSPKGQGVIAGRVDEVAKELRSGHMPENVKEKRIAYAITAAYLEESGELDRRIAHAQDVEEYRARRQATSLEPAIHIGNPDVRLIGEALSRHIGAPQHVEGNQTPTHGAASQRQATRPGPS